MGAGTGPGPGGGRRGCSAQLSSPPQQSFVETRNLLPCGSAADGRYGNGMMMHGKKLDQIMDANDSNSSLKQIYGMKVPPHIKHVHPPHPSVIRTKIEATKPDPKLYCESLTLVHS